MSISIIIPYYRAPKLLSATLETIHRAVLNCRGIAPQGSFELIVVDDSAEGTATEALQQLVVNFRNPFYSIVTVVNGNNCGIAESRNVGAAIAKGAFLHFVDQDDFVSANYYADMLMMLDTAIDVTISNCYIRKDNADAPYFRDSMLNKLKKTDHLRDFKILTHINLFPSVGQFLLRRTLFNEAGGFPIKQHQGTDDWGLWLKLWSLNPSTACCFKSIFVYQLHENNSRKSLNMYLSAKETLREFYQYENRQLSLLERLMIQFKIHGPKVLIQSINAAIVRYYYHIPN